MPYGEITLRTVSRQGGGPILKLRLKQKCYYFPVTYSNFMPVPGDPQEVSCRWADRQELRRDQAGQERMSKSVCWVDFKPDTAGFFSLSPDKDTANQIMAIESMTDLQGRNIGWKVWL